MAFERQPLLGFLIGAIVLGSGGGWMIARAPADDRRSIALGLGAGLLISIIIGVVLSGLFPDHHLVLYEDLGLRTH